MWNGTSDDEYRKKNLRNNVNVDIKYQNDSVWIIWDAILYYGNLKSKFVKNMLDSLLYLFCLKYTPSIILVDKLKKMTFNRNNKRDYYFLVLNKNNPDEVIINSIKLKTFKINSKDIIL